MPARSHKLSQKGMDAGRTRDTYRLAQDHDRDMQDEDICDDHDEDPAYLTFIPHNQMESRIKDQSLTGHHEPPTDTDENAGNVSILPDSEIEQKKAEWMESAAPGGEQQTPEIKADISLEAYPDSHLQFDSVDPGNCDKGRNDHGGR